MSSTEPSADGVTHRLYIESTLQTQSRSASFVLQVLRCQRPGCVSVTVTGGPAAVVNAMVEAMIKEHDLFEGL